MPLGSSVNGSTVTFDLFLRSATQGPIGPLVMYKSLTKMIRLYYINNNLIEGDIAFCQPEEF